MSDIPRSACGEFRNAPNVDSVRPILHYWANNRRRAGVIGVTRGNAADFVQTAYRKGWRWLRVESEGVEVGGITEHLDTGKRTWWAEDAAQPTQGGSGSSEANDG